MGELQYGTASWSEESWEGVFYPKGTAPGDYLTYYASQFTTVEANVTYYRIPSPHMVSAWDRKTPDGFILAAKFPRSIVHAGKGPRPDSAVLLDPDKTGRDVEQFLDAMDLLGAKCGPLVLQFPYFNKQAFSGSAPFFARLDVFLAGLPNRFRYAVEIRNRNCLDPETGSLRNPAPPPHCPGLDRHLLHAASRSRRGPDRRSHHRLRLRTADR